MRSKAAKINKMQAADDKQDREEHNALRKKHGGLVRNGGMQTQWLAGTAGMGQANLNAALCEFPGAEMATDDGK